MIRQSVLSKSLTLSFLLHAGLVGLLVLFASKPPVFPDTPLRVRILEPSTGQESRSTPPSADLATPSLPRGREPSTQRVPEGREGVSGAGRGSSKPGPTLGEPSMPSIRRAPDPPRKSPDVVPPERTGLSLGGPPQAVSPFPQEKPEPPGTEPRRPSLREQIASLGSGLWGDAGGSAKQTVNLNSRDPLFMSYLAQVKRRIERVWVYPEEARNNGVSGELLLVFTLNKAGTLTNLQLVQGSGFPILDEEALRAVKLAAPFDPFPPQIGEEPWNIAASFRYFLPYRFRRN